MRIWIVMLNIGYYLVKSRGGTTRRMADGEFQKDCCHYFEKYFFKLSGIWIISDSILCIYFNNLFVDLFEYYFLNTFRIFVSRILDVFRLFHRSLLSLIVILWIWISFLDDCIFSRSIMTTHLIFTRMFNFKI